MSRNRNQSQSEPVLPSSLGIYPPVVPFSYQRPLSAGAYRAKKYGPSSLISLKYIQSALDYQSGYFRKLPDFEAREARCRSVTSFLGPLSTETVGHKRICNHEDLLRTPRDTLVMLQVGDGIATSAYVVKFDLFSVYADFILTSPCDQWFHSDSGEPARLGRVQRQFAPLLTTLNSLQDILDWLEHEEILSFRLVQVADCSTRDSFIKEEDDDVALRSQISRVQRLRSFNSFEEAAAAVFLDGSLQGISSVFGCIVLDSSKTDSATYSTIKMQCKRQMHDYFDIVVKEVGDRLFIY